MFDINKFYQLSEPETLRFPRIPRWIYLTIIVVLTFVFVVGGIFVAGSMLNTILTAVLTGSETTSTSPAATARSLIASFISLFLLVQLALDLFERRGLSSIGLQRRNAVRNYSRGLAVGLIMMGTIVLILWLLGAVTFENPVSTASIAGAFIVLLGYVVQGAAEEVLFRGFLLQIFGRMTNTPFAIIVSSVLFTVMHAGVPGIDNMARLNVFLIAVLLAVYTLYEGSLWGVCAIHTIYNWAQGNLFGIEFSTRSNEGAAVFNLVQTGPEIIAGGEFGLENGFIVTIVALAGLLLLFRFGKRLQSSTNAVDVLPNGTIIDSQDPINSIQRSKFDLKKATRWVARAIVVIVVLVVLVLTGLSNWFPFTSFEVRGDQLWLNGMMNGHTVRQFNNLLEENPDITTLVLEDVPGAARDEAIADIAYTIREKGMRTHLASHSVIISGGSWLFIAGSERTMERGAEIIVHSGTGLAKEASEYPRDAPEHEPLRGYVHDMLGSDEWYWFSINAADFAGGYSMTEAEIFEYGLLTQPIIE